MADADFLRISWSGVQIVVAGTILRTLGALAYVTSRFAPDAIWPHGAGVRIHASASLTPDVAGACNLDGTPAGGTNSGPKGNAQGTATGGWRYKIGGASVVAPVTVPGILSHASGTTADAVTSESSFTIGTASKFGYGAEIEIVPDWPCEVIRMDPDDYEALVLRQASPERLQRGGVVTIERCKEELASGSGTTNSPFPDVTLAPARSEFLDAVTSATSLVEINLSQSKVCGGVSTEFTESFPTATSVGTSHLITGAGPVAGPFDHFDEWCRLHNTLAAPHWGLTLFAPYEDASGDGLPGAGYQWKISGTPAGWGEYWAPLRQQHIDHSALPSDRRSKRRNHIHAEPVLQNGYAGRMGTLYGSRSSWWGIPRFDVRTPVRPISVPFDARSAELYHGDATTDPAPSVSSAGVTIAAGETAIEIELSSWSVWPYQTVKSCDRVTIDWPSGANVSTVSAHLVADDAFITGETPTRTPIPFTKGTPARLPVASGKAWWTTAGIDFGAGYIGDRYMAVAPTVRDASAAFANVAEREDTPPLAPARSGVRLRIEVVPIDAAQPTKLRYPTFLPAPLGDARALAETARHSAFLLKEGPPLRYGHHGYYDYAADSTVPYGIPEPAMAGSTTVGDALCFTRAFLEARPPLDALEAEMRRLYEWPTEMTMVDHVWRDAYDQIVTHAFALPLVAPGSFGLVSSYRTLPPCGVTPARKRTKESVWTATGAYGLHSYSHCPTRQWLHTPVATGHEASHRPRLTIAGDDILSAPPIGLVPSGHAAGWHRLALTGSEGYDATIGVRFGAEWRDLAKVRPWRGFSAIWGQGHVAATGGVHNLATRDGRFATAIAGADGARVRSWDAAVPSGPPHASVEVATGAGYESARLCQDRRLALLVDLGRVEGLTITATTRRSTDSGRTWSEPEPMPIPHCRFPLTVSGHGPELVTIGFVPDDPSDSDSPGVLKGYYRPTPDSPPSIVRTLSLASGPLRVEGRAFGHHPAREGAGRWIVTAVAEGEDEERSWSSADVAASFTLTPL